jgi:hypothetical protein
MRQRYEILGDSTGVDARPSSGGVVEKSGLVYDVSRFSAIRARSSHAVMRRCG